MSYIESFVSKAIGTCPICNEQYQAGTRLAKDKNSNSYGHQACIINQVTNHAAAGKIDSPRNGVYPTHIPTFVKNAPAADNAGKLTRSPDPAPNSAGSSNTNPISTDTPGQVAIRTSTAASPYASGEYMTNQNEIPQSAEKPTDKQKEWLAKKGVSAAEVAKMTKQEATKKLDELFGNQSSGSPASAFQPSEPVKVLGTLDELFQISDSIREHILKANVYNDLTEIGQMKTWEVLLNNYTKSKITEGISSNSRKRGR